MRIQPGFYKIRRKSGLLLSGNHYMRVFIHERKKYIQIDHGLVAEAEKIEQEVLEDYKIIKQITISKPIQVNTPLVTVEWNDEDGDHFEMKARNIHALKSIFELFPRVAKALGFRKVKH